MNIQKAIRYTKQAVKIAETDSDFEMCAEAILKIQKELELQEKGQGWINLNKKQTKGFFRTYEQSPQNTKLKRLVRE